MLTVDNTGSSGDPGEVPGGGAVHTWLALQAPGIVSGTDNLGVWKGPSQSHREQDKFPGCGRFLSILHVCLPQAPVCVVECPVHLAK